jgi:hypothetical protein
MKPQPSLSLPFLVGVHFLIVEEALIQHGSDRFLREATA